MTRLMVWLGFVLFSSLVGGVVGGWVGRFVGTRSPSFVQTISDPRMTIAPFGFDPPEFGYGLGIVTGLFLGLGAGVALVFCSCVREFWRSRPRALRALSRSGRVAPHALTVRTNSRSTQTHWLE